MQNQLFMLRDNVSEIMRTLHQRSYHKMEGKCLYPGQPKLLSLIKANEGIPQKELSEKNFVTPATITGMINKLEAKHYLYRVPDETDKRIMRVYLTPEGRQLADQGEEFHYNTMLQLFEGFTDEEFQTMIALTDKMKHNLHKYES